CLCYNKTAKWYGSCRKLISSDDLVFSSGCQGLVEHSHSVPTTGFLLWENYFAMEEQVDVGMVKVIRISNFNCKQIDGLLSKPDSKYKPANNQIESHPYLLQVELIPFCQSKGIFVTVYHPFGPEDVSLFDDPQVKEIALMHSKIAARVLIWLQIQRNMSLIPRSITPHCTKENIKVTLQNLTLTQRNPLWSRTKYSLHI
uniref:NADP-dependent oxidoreductase domain-containing protein n=1 Tax=Gallus gallus TaxID=9031 RepID=A0A8V0YJR7_CHICK